MRLDDVQQKLTPILRDVFDDDTLVADPQLTAANVDDWDSLSHIRLILTLEKQFGITFAASEMTNLKNVGDLMRVIVEKTS